MKTNKLFQNSAIVTAVLASLCCITPVLAVLGGLSGIATTFDFLEPLRPYFIAFTAIILGYAFYNAYKPKKETDIECACEEDYAQGGKKTKFINSKAFLWTVAIVAAILITFPYYSQVLFPKLEASSTNVNTTNLVNAEIQIEGMTCTACEHSVDYALKSETGVINASSSYKTGVAKVEYDKSKITPEKLKKTVEEKVGYKVKRVESVKDGKSK
jgi:copper chaperone CopZ